MEFPVRIVNGNLLFQNLMIASDGFQIYAQGQVGLNGQIDCVATLAMDPYLSGLLITNIPTMQYIADSYGRLILPVKIHGTVDHVRIIPDMEYVINRVIQGKGKEFLLDALKKSL